MSVLIRNPGASLLPLPYPFRAVLEAGQGVVLALTIAQVREALGTKASALFELKEVGDLVGDPFALGVYGAEAIAPLLIPFAGTALGLTAAHFGNYLRCTSAAPVALTLPAGLGLSDVRVQSLLIRQAGDGQITLVQSGTTIAPRDTLGLLSAGKGATLCLSHISGEAYDLTGDAAA